MSSSNDEDELSYYDAHASGGSEEGETREIPQDAMTSSPASSDWPGYGSKSAQSNPAATTSSPAKSTLLHRRTLEGSSVKSRNRYSLPEPVPTIPAHFLAYGKRAAVASPLSPRKESLKQLQGAYAPPLPNSRPSTSGGERRSASVSQYDIDATRAASSTKETHRKSLPPFLSQFHKETLSSLESRRQRRKSTDMSRLGRRGNEDVFLELANDHAGAEEPSRPTSRGGLVSSRLSFSDKRRSLLAENGLPTSAERGLKSSGQVLTNNRPSLRDSVNGPSDLQRHMDRYRSPPSRASFRPDDAISISTRSRTGRSQRYTIAPERPSSLLDGPLQSPELPQYGRRRPSFGATTPHSNVNRANYNSGQAQDAVSESPADSSEPKRSLPDSESVESQTEDRVWDELDDLKSRIKNLESTGKLSAASPAAVSNEINERPRTATTAPTTIDSSPKNFPKHVNQARAEKAETVERSEMEQEAEPEHDPDSAGDVPAEPSADLVVGGQNVANIHPTLHSALAKAKPLLNPRLYRTLEATAAEALQLAAMTGSAGPQGTAFSAAAIINGVTVLDRHVRRKADTMCRNLTDLCLALCEGKHQASSVLSSPVALDTPAKSSPSIRLPRRSVSPNGIGARPMSRLESRRASILGSQAGSSFGNSPLESGEEFSASEYESTPSQAYLKVQEARRFSGSRASSRLQMTRAQRYGEAGEDEDPTVRPLSRALTDAGREKRLVSREYNTPPQQQRSPGPRDANLARRANAAAHDANRDASRVSSMASDSGGRRRYHEYATPPVREEEEGPNDEYQPSSQPKRRITSFGGQYGSRRAAMDLPQRATSLSQKRQVVLE